MAASKSWRVARQSWQCIISYIRKVRAATRAWRLPMPAYNSPRARAQPLALFLTRSSTMARGGIASRARHHVAITHSRSICMASAAGGNIFEKSHRIMAM